MRGLSVREGGSHGHCVRIVVGVFLLRDTIADTSRLISRRFSLTTFDVRERYELHTDSSDA